MIDLVEMEDIKHSLGVIREEAGPLKDDMLNLLLDMAILHLARKLASAIDKPIILPALSKRPTAPERDALSS